MASYAISNFCYKGVINLLRTVIFTIGIVCLGYGLWSVTTNKLETLKEKNDRIENNQVTVAEKTKQLECLTKNIYWEAAGEPFEGKVAVAQVTLNRVESGKFGSTVCQVVFQKNVFYEKLVCQFSWVCEQTGRTKPVSQKGYKESEEVAKRVLLENFRLPSLTNALYFHSVNVNPKWGKEKIVQIGQHIFYKD
jgi:spore germination cell wall hydrolase CwlJ-like protein